MRFVFSFEMHEEYEYISLYFIVSLLRQNIRSFAQNVINMKVHRCNLIPI